MRKIKTISWLETRQTANGETEEVKSNSLDLIRVMIQTVSPQRLPTGLEAYEIMKSVHESLKSAKGKDVLILEDKVYDWIEENIFPQIPAVWGLNTDLSSAIDHIINAEKIDVNKNSKP